MSNKTQNILYAFILFLTIVICSILSPTPQYRVQGIYLPSSNETYSPIKVSNVTLTQVKVGTSTEVGHINTMVHFNDIKKETLDNLYKLSIQKLKEIAAKNGANKIYITTAGRTQNQGPLDGIIIQAIAYRQ